MRVHVCVCVSELMHLDSSKYSTCTVCDLVSVNYCVVFLCDM